MKAYKLLKQIDNEKSFMGCSGAWVEKALSGIIASFAVMGATIMSIGVNNKIGLVIGLSIFFVGSFASLTICRTLSKRYGRHGIEKMEGKKKLPRNLRRKSIDLNIK